MTRETGAGFLQARTTHFDVKLHFGDEQFEVDAAQLPIAFTQVTLGGGGGAERETLRKKKERHVRN